MGHLFDRCDLIDVLEASVRMHRPVMVELKDGRSFVDEARDVTDGAAGDWAIFRLHDRVPLGDISFCGPAEPPEATYRGKPARSR